MPAVRNLPAARTMVWLCDFLDRDKVFYQKTVVKDKNSINNCPQTKLGGGSMSIIDDVTDCVIAHYRRRFRRNDIHSDTDIKERFNFSAASWAAEAEALSNLECIKKLGVRIAQVRMNDNTTPVSIGVLVDGLVRDKAKSKKKAAVAKGKAKVAKKAKAKTKGKKKSAKKSSE